MVQFRKRTSWIVAGWLVCQLLALSAPLAVGLTAFAAADDACTCPGGTLGAECPMHHHTLTDVKDANRPGVRSACAAPDVALLSLATGLGVLPRPTVLLLDGTSAPLVTFGSIPVHRSELPDSPPPRA